MASHLNDLKSRLRSGSGGAVQRSPTEHLRGLYMYRRRELSFKATTTMAAFSMPSSKRQKLSGTDQAHFPPPGAMNTSASTSTSAPTPREWPQYSPSTGAHPSPFGSTGWYQDGFSHDPGYLASQEELRSMLFSIAESGEQVRGGSPDGTVSLSSPGVMNNALSNGRRIKYLKNYVGEVAPWVNQYL